jgi:hypothetical protein
MFILDTTTGVWSSGPDVPNNDTCNLKYMGAWRGKLAVPGYSAVEVYDPTPPNAMWLPAAIPYPPGAMSNWQVAVVNGGNDLYALADFGTNIVIYKYTFN